MKFTSAPDWMGMNNMVMSENRMVYIGVYPVMFGHRVRAGFYEDENCCVLDWCAGKDWSELYATLREILEGRSEDYDCFDGLPMMSRIKPYYNDKEFCDHINGLREKACAMRQ